MMACLRARCASARRPSRCRNSARAAARAHGRPVRPRPSRPELPPVPPPVRRVPQGDRAVQRHHPRGIQTPEHVVERHDPAPVGRGEAGRRGMNGGDGRLATRRRARSGFAPWRCSPGPRASGPGPPAARCGPGCPPGLRGMLGAASAREAPELRDRAGGRPRCGRGAPPRRGGPLGSGLARLSRVALVEGEEEHVKDVAGALGQIRPGGRPV